MLRKNYLLTCTFCFLLSVMLSFKLGAGNWLNSSRGTGISARLEHEPPNFPASSHGLMRTFMSVIKTIALANQDCAPGSLALGWDSGC